jgi:hypothetical protein
MTGAAGTALALAASILLGSGCSSTEDPFASGPAHATVSGVVTNSQGGAIPGTTVGIACAGVDAPIILTTDSAGRYIANLATGPDPFWGRSARLRCRFAEPSSGMARIQVDTTLGFVRGPVLVAIQFIDLAER